MRRVSCIVLLGVLSNFTSCAQTTPHNGLGIPVLENLWTLNEDAAGHTAVAWKNVLLAGDFETEELKAVDLDTHKVLWKRDIDVDTGATIFGEQGDFLFVKSTYSRSQKILVMNRKGQTLNTIELPGAVLYGQSGNAGPTLVNGLMYLAQNTSIYVYDVSNPLKKDLEPLWSKTFKHMFAFDVDPSGNVYASADISTDKEQNHLVSFTKEGTQRWSISADVLSPYPHVDIHQIRVEGDVVLTAASGGQLHAYDTQTGQPKWNAWSSYNTCPGTSAPSASSVLVAEGKIFVVPVSGICVNAFDLKTGKALWVFSSPNVLTFASQPAYHNGVLYASNHRLWAIDAETGKPLGVSGFNMYGTQFNAVVHFDPIRNQILLWGFEGLYAFKPVR
ncbi:MAG: PQQ-binding-like beta-propeller repeat protein [Deinococcaceae bacterium]